MILTGDTDQGKATKGDSSCASWRPVNFLLPEDSTESFHVVEMISIMESKTWLGMILGDCPVDDEALESLGLPAQDSQTWVAFNNMLALPYFSRVWIIQELASSSKYQLLWGDITISDKEFDSMRDRLVSLSMIITDATEDCPRIKWTPVPFKLNDTYYGLTAPYEDRWDDKDLFTLVQWASRSKATDQRDKIYALIGLSGQLHYNMEPDYSKSESEVFAEFATKVISTNKDLEILRHTHVEDPNEPKRSPLWAPRNSRTA